MSLDRLDRSRRRPERLCVGLLSGTSADGAEAALCRISGSRDTLRLEVIEHATLPFPRELSSRIVAVRDVEDACALSFELGEWFARAALTVLEHAGVSAEQVDVIGSHGQTIAHLPPGRGPTPSTLQIGEAAVIAARTGIPTVSDFRTGDVAAGGHGAPLVPYLDWALFRPQASARALLNVGGIANVSVVRARLEDTIAFDTGPGNMILDGLAERTTGGMLRCDLDGQLSEKGQVIPELLRELLSMPALSAPPPRSLGRENFGAPLIEALWRRHGDRPADLIATALWFTARATAEAIDRHVRPHVPAIEALYVSGGGGRNPNLMRALQEALSPLEVRPLGDLGFPEAAKEAACFALLAHEWLNGAPQNVPSATGASRRVLLGKMTP